MLDDDTLAAWGKNIHEDTYHSVHYVGDRLLEAIAEIRRLREFTGHDEGCPVREFGGPDPCSCLTPLREALAAHRAVVRAGRDGMRICECRHVQGAHCFCKDAPAGHCMVNSCECESFVAEVADAKIS